MSKAPFADNGLRQDRGLRLDGNRARLVGKVRMTDGLLDILEGRHEAALHALAAAEAELAQNGGDWFAAGCKGAALLFLASDFTEQRRVAPYHRAGLALIGPALAAAQATGPAAPPTDPPRRALLQLWAGLALVQLNAPGDAAEAKLLLAEAWRASDLLPEWAPVWAGVALALAAERCGDRAQARQAFAASRARDEAEAVRLYARFKTLPTG